jgi:hypothetical protein
MGAPRYLIGFEEMRASLPRLTDRLRLGALEVSPFCLGMVTDPDTVLAAYDAGINFFFVTADMHWPLYEELRLGLARLLARGGGVRDRIVIASVSYATQPEFCRLPFREVLDAMPGLGHLDVLVAGGAYGHELDQRLAVYREHRAKHFVGARAIGASFHDRAAALPHVRDGSLDISLIRFNVEHLGARDDVFPHVGGRRGLMFNFKSASGWVSPEAFARLGLDPAHWQPGVPDHYRFVLSHVEVDGILCSLSTPAHVGELVGALDDGPLELEEQEHLVLLAKLAGGRGELVHDGSAG